MTSDGVTSVAPNYALARLGSGNDRLQKSAYADVLEYTKNDNRFYANERLANFYRWLFSASVGPSKQYHMFGDTPHNRYPNNNVLLWRVGRFDFQASQYAAWLLSEYTPPGHLLSYVLMQEPLPAPVLPQSQLFHEGGAVFRETQDSSYALGAALYNITENAEWHTHDETNAISVAGYGNRLLVNGGWMGDRMRPPAKNNTIAIDGKRHLQQTGDGLTEGILGNGFDYANGASGNALGDDSFTRSLVQMHARDDAGGYFLYVDEVDADAGEKVHAYLQTASESEITEVTPVTEYQAAINHHAKVPVVHLSVFYATPPLEVFQSLVESGAHEHDPTSGNHYRLEARYATDSIGDIRTLVALFPHNASHPKAVMNRLSGKGFTGLKLSQPKGVSDFAYISDGATSCLDNEIAFHALLAVVRKVGETDGLYFARKGLKLKTGIVGFESDRPVSLLMDGKNGTIAGEGAKLTLYYPGITNVLLDRLPAESVSSGNNWFQFMVPTGSHALLIVSD